MTRVIKIETCRECPNVGHTGGFGSPAYKPRCGLLPVGRNILPYHPGISGERIVAKPTYVIPDNCPLPRLPAQPTRAHPGQLSPRPIGGKRQYQFEWLLGQHGIKAGMLAIHTSGTHYINDSIQILWLAYLLGEPFDTDRATALAKGE